ncbi:MAG TPA: RecQ family ATP-dependent DNA helicase [Candidatus Kapabacteria bacterium]|nr:RecQ family ATP-dependent DNA helicase [Candidatus Kapabacteria bacterium]
MGNLVKYLNKYFGYENFRDGQQEIINSIINCNDTLVVMATGGGKSLCYQLPATVMNGTALVISPLMALMKDQVDALIGKSIPATLINSSIDFSEVVNRMNDAIRGVYKLIYISPERLENKSFLRMLKKINISFVAVDEAHCISEWGHDFRPSYNSINNMFEHIERVPVIALTATATPIVQNDIVKILNLKSENRFIKGFDRKNLNYRTKLSNDKISDTLDILADTKNGSTIIYAGSRKRTETFAIELQKYKINAEMYHAGLKQQLRDAVQSRFIKDKTKVIVATNAFGMGIDKADVRNVIHIDLTSTLEQYYQEAGRAGRDGKDAMSILLYHPSDINLQNFFIQSNYPSKSHILKAYDFIKKNSLNGIVPSALTLANEIGLSQRSTETILKLLERDAVICRVNFSQNASIRITTTTDRISEYFNNLNPDKQQVLEELLRITPREAFRRTVDIDLKQLNLNSIVQKEKIEEAIRAFNFSGNIEISNYNAEISENQFVFDYSSSLNINYNELADREKFAYNKLSKVIEYAETNQCKRHYILKYFGEKNDNTNDNCNNCSSCNANDSKLIKIKQRTDYLESLVLKLVDELRDYYTEREIATILLGKKSAFKIANTDEIKDYYGAAMDYNKQETEELISKLLTKRYIQKSVNKKMIITPLGKSQLKYN